MAFPTVCVAIAKVVMDAKLKVVEDLAAFLETKIEMDDDMKGFLVEFKNSLKDAEDKAVKEAGKKGKKSKSSDSSDTEKKKRAPSVFNLYVKDVMPEIKATHPDIKNGKQLIALAGEDWKTSAKAKFIKEKVEELKKDKKDMPVVELYEEAKSMYSDESDVDVKEAKKKEPKKEKEPAKPKSKKAKEPESEEDE